MKEIIINEEFTVIELFRNNTYEYYLSKKDYGNLLFCFGAYEKVSKMEIIDLFNTGYFMPQIEDFENMD